MNTDKWHLIQSLFEQALDLEKSKRQSFLQQACLDDPELYKEVLSLLEEDTNTHSLLEGVAFDFVDLETKLNLIGQKIGPYRIVREIGYGGMGAVFLAERVEGEFEQQVALKLIKRGMDSGQILNRFRSERQILAILKHTNIARLLDGGMTEDGLPYFAMEYVEGKPINEYCDENKLTVKERLQLFQKICAAVQYAHQNLIVHRDLKPSNILVSKTGEVKLLDFGIAKMLLDDSDSPAGLALTRTGQRVMTPQYAAPEQVRGEPITTATDIYTLGVILYELLTGKTPHQLENSTQHEIEKAICDTQPKRPSTAVTKKQLNTKNNFFWQKPGNLSRQLSGDIDNICLMALRKEPERRYHSAQQFSEDIQRYLTGLTVRARPDTFGYSTQKFVQRNKIAVMSTVAVIFLIAFLVTFYTMRLATERDRARLEAQKAEQVSEFLSGLFEVSDPSQSKGETITARELLDKGAQRIKEELTDQPEVQAAMMGVVGSVYRSLGLYDAAQEQLLNVLFIKECAQNADSLEVADALYALAEAYYDAFDHETTTKYLSRALKLQLNQLHASDAALIKSLHLLAQTNYLEGKYEAADSIYKVILDDVEPASKLLSNIQRDYGVLQRELGNFETAENIYRKSLQATQKSYGQVHPEVARVLHYLGDALRKQGKLDEAEPVYRKALDMREKLFDDVHPDIGETLNHLARLLYQKGDYDAAEPLARRALKVRLQIYGEENVTIVASKGNLAGILKAKGNLDEAERLYRWNLNTLRKLVGDEHPYIGAALNSVASILLAKGDLQRAEEMYRQSLALHRKVLPENHHNLSRPLHGLAQVLLKSGDLQGAEKLLNEAIDLTMNTQGSYWRTAEVQVTLGRCLLLQKNFSAAEPYLLQSYQTLQKQYPDRIEGKEQVLKDIISLYEKWDRDTKADPYRKLLTSNTK